MKQDRYGQLIYNENDLVDLYLTNPNIQLKNTLVSTNIVFNDELSIKNIPNFTVYTDSDKSIEQFDLDYQSSWYIPEEYMNFDIAKFVLDQCKTEEELQRAGQELLMYQERDMFILLRYLKYLVDTMRKNNIVWGVGRGSSVASFVLFLIGVHKINSLHYDLSIDEFLR